MNVTSKQKEMLLILLKKNPELVRGRVDRKTESRRKLVEYWENVANTINAAAEGPRKNGKEWAKTWKDIKGYILKKESKRRTHTQGTGGGPPCKISFSSFEEEVLEILTPEAAGLMNIPEGGINIETPCFRNNLENHDIIEDSNYSLNIPGNDMNIEESNTFNESERATYQIKTQIIESHVDVVHAQINDEINEENVSPNILQQRKKNTTKGVNNKEAEKISGNRKGYKENYEVSHKLLQIQAKKYKLKKKQVKFVKTALNVQHEMLSELKNIKLSLQSWMTPEIIT